MELNSLYFPKQKLSKPRGLVFLLHGYGGNASGILHIAKSIVDGDSSFDDIMFIAPNGISKWESNYENAYQWFSLRSLAAHDLINACSKVIPEIQAYILREIEAASLSLSDVVFAGFSQGGMLAIELGMMSRWPGDAAPRGVASMSGGFLGGGIIQRTIVNKNIDVLLTHGAADSVVPVSFTNRTKAILDSVGMNDSIMVIEHGVNHSIGATAMDALRNFCKQCFE